MLIHEPWPTVWLYGWELGRNIIGKIGNKDIWGRVMWTDLSKWVKNMKIFFLSHVNVHQRMTSEEILIIK